MDSSHISFLIVVLLGSFVCWRLKGSSVTPDNRLFKFEEFS